MALGELKGLYQDVALRNIAIKRKRQGYLIPLIAALFPVGKLSGTMYRRDPNNADLRVNNTVRAPGGQVKMLYSENPIEEEWRIRCHSLGDLLPDELRATEEPIQDEINKVEKIVDNLNLEREVKGKANMIAAATAANTGTGVNASHLQTLTGTSQINATNAINPCITIARGINQIVKKTGRRPNFIAMDSLVAQAWIENEAFQNKIHFTTSIAANNMGTAAMATLIGNALAIDRVYLAEGVVQNIGDKGGTQSLSEIWGDDIILGIIEPASLEYQGTMLNLTYSGTIPGGGDGSTLTAKSGYTVERGRVVDRKSDLFVVHSYYDDKVIEENSIFVFRDALA
jgi:hypothetical protein